MARNAPNKFFRKSVSLERFMDMLSIDNRARDSFEAQLMSERSYLGTDNVQFGIRYRTMTHCCLECARWMQFRLRRDAVIISSKLNCRDWVVAVERGHKRVFHKLSRTYLQKYVNKLLIRHNIRNINTVGQVTIIVKWLFGKEMRYADLSQDNGLKNGARP